MQTTIIIFIALAVVAVVVMFIKFRGNGGFFTPSRRPEFPDFKYTAAPPPRPKNPNDIVINSDGTLTIPPYAVPFFLDYYSCKCTCKRCRKSHFK